MAADLLQLHDMASALLQVLEPGPRNRLLRRMAVDIRRANQRRMARQKAPDGTAWEPRQPRRQAEPVIQPKRFLYPSGGTGEPRLVFMRSWRPDGHTLIGFDQEADGIRTFVRKKVIAWLPAEGEGGGPDAPPVPRGRGRRKGQTMFRGLRSSRYLRTGAGSDAAWVEFAGKAEQIALIHHEGRRDQVAADGPEVDYPERPLLGFSPADERWILNSFIDQAGSALGWSPRAST